MKNTTELQHATLSTHEPAIAVHDVFSVSIPGAFGISFLHRLITQPNESSDGAAYTKGTKIMPKRTTTTRIKTARPVTESDLLHALKNSLDPCFAHLEEKLLEGDGQVLDIRITVKAGKIKLEYGVGEI